MGVKHAKLQSDVSSNYLISKWSACDGEEVIVKPAISGTVVELIPELGSAILKLLRNALWKAASEGRLKDVIRLAGTFGANHWVLGQALYRACDGGWLDVVTWLVKNTVLQNDVKQLSEALYRACGSNNVAYDNIVDNNKRLDVVTWLVEHTVLRHEMKTLSKTLKRACYHGNVDVVKWLMAQTPVHDDLKTMNGALNRASYNGQWIVMKWMIRYTDITVNYSDYMGNTILHCTIWYTKDRGVTSLHKACRRGSLGDIRRLLYHHGYDIDVQDNDGNTPLHEASRLGNSDVIKFLMLASADETIMNDRGQTPAQAAMNKQRGRQLMLLNRNTLNDFYTDAEFDFEFLP